MEDQCSPLSWVHCNQEEGMEELKQSLVYTTFELETTLLSAHEEITRRECELIHLKDLLNRTIKERDEAKAKCQRLLLEKFVLQKQLLVQQQQQQRQQQQQQQYQKQQQQQQQEAAQLYGISSSDDESRGSDFQSGFSPSDSDQNVIAPLGMSPIQSPPLPPPIRQATIQLAAKKPLPEKGKLLQAVIEAGPLLQTLLLAGPLPQWQHPPPQLDSIEIPPVTISSSTPHLLHPDSCISNNGCFSKKRGLVPCESSDPAPNKYQRVHQLTNTKYSS